MRDSGYEIWDLENRNWEFGINLKVPREWIDPIVAPDAESRLLRDEEIRGKISTQNRSAVGTALY
jgi:hypothetical protein